MAGLALLAAAAVGGGLQLHRLDREEQRLSAVAYEAARRAEAAARLEAHLEALLTALEPPLTGEPPAIPSSLMQALAMMREALGPPPAPSLATPPTSEAPTADSATPSAPAGGQEATLAARLEALAAALRPGAVIELRALARERAELVGPLRETFARHAAVARAEAETAAGRRTRLGLVLATVSVLAVGVATAALSRLRSLRCRLAALETELGRLAGRDPVTGLASRPTFLGALETALAARRPVVLVRIDLDRLEEINSALGHAAGDAVLCATARRIAEQLRAADLAGRLGDDELACLLPEIPEDRPVETVLARLRTALQEPVPIGERTVRVGATLGVARFPEDAVDPERLVRAAGEALARAKRNGRGGIGRATAGDATRAERLARALRDLDGTDPPEAPEGLDVALQPIAALTADVEEPGALLGFEALARWHHPSLGAIAPEELLPAAAASGRAARLGRVLRRRAFAAFTGLGPEAIDGRFLAVNLAPGEVANPELEAELAADLAAFGLPWRALCLEIAEQLLVERLADDRLAALVRLHERGVRLALDDFGTGGSSLAQLLRLPIDVLKIDGRFVAALPGDPRAREIVRATLGLAAGLGLEVVAEGIEEPAQAALLAQLGCRAGQGWAIGRPLQGEALRAFCQGRSIRDRKVAALRA